MIGIDTNVLMRFVLQDDAQQSKQAKAFFFQLSESNKGFLSVTTIVESVWVLESTYKLTRTQVGEFLRWLLNARELVLEQPMCVGEAIRLYATGADFADALIASAGRAAGCKTTVSFDRGAIKYAHMSPVP